jgi:hypothetical protein
VPSTAAVHSSRCPVFPSPCGQRLARGPGACGMTAVAGCPGNGTRWPSPALPAAGDALVASGRGARTSGVPETPGRTAVSGPAGMVLRRQDRAGRVLIRRSSTAAPSTRPRRDLRGASATPGSRTNGRIGMPVCAAVGGPVSAAAETASPLHCPRLTLSCQAICQPPVGAATRSTGRCALPYQRAPQGGSRRKAPAPLRSARATDACHPAPPSRGRCGSRTAPRGQRLCRSCHGSSAGFPPSVQAFGM